MNITSISVPLIALLSALLGLATLLVFSIAFFLWWRRLGHWSFALLSAATALSGVAQISSFLATQIILRFGKLEHVTTLNYAKSGVHLVIGVLLLVGAFGLVSAARDYFLVDDAKRQSDAA